MESAPKARLASGWRVSLASDHHGTRPSITRQASMEFLRVTFGDVPEAERQKVRAQLERYCGLDTEGMIWIVDALNNV